jgi:hypothetical protein
MPRPTADTSQITFRLPNAWLVEADEIARHLSRPGFEASRTDALRACIAKGIEAFRAEFAIEAESPKKPRSKR